MFIEQKRKIPIIETRRTVLTVLNPEKSHFLYKYYKENRDHLSPWEPIRSGNYYSENEVFKRVEASYRLFAEEGMVVPFTALNRDSDEVVGVCTFSNIVMGPFRACHLGYSIAEKYEGTGLMFEILQSAIVYMFSEIKLHRIMANYIPENRRSAVLLERLGFEKEGVARSYLKIAGEWRDHILTSKINQDDL